MIGIYNGMRFDIFQLKHTYIYTMCVCEIVCIAICTYIYILQTLEYHVFNRI